MKDEKYNEWYNKVREPDQMWEHDNIGLEVKRMQEDDLWLWEAIDTAINYMGDYYPDLPKNMQGDKGVGEKREELVLLYRLDLVVEKMSEERQAVYESYDRGTFFTALQDFICIEEVLTETDIERALLEYVA